MSDKTSDQGWQKLQAHIEGFFGQALRNDVQKIGRVESWRSS